MLAKDVRMAGYGVAAPRAFYFGPANDGRVDLRTDGAVNENVYNSGEHFSDSHTSALTSNIVGGSGTINRFTGDVSFTFGGSAPITGTLVLASYSYYVSSQTLKPFTTGNVTNNMLALTNYSQTPASYGYNLCGSAAVSPTQYLYDFVMSGVDPSTTTADANCLVQWIRGWANGSTATTQKDWLLGPIYYSVPAVLTPPGTPYWYYGTALPDAAKTAYKTFAFGDPTDPSNLKGKSQRRSVLFVGSLDGMLHCFDAGAFRWGDNPATTFPENRGYFAGADYGDGHELWAFIPNNLIGRLKNNAMNVSNQSYVDASPAIADVYVYDSSQNATVWKSVVLSAEGSGGDTVFCLDVTDPTTPKFMWEFADPDLYRSRSSPGVGQIGQIMYSGSSKWVAFFVSGQTADSNADPSIYMIDIADGSVLQRIYLDSAGADGHGGIPSGQPALIDSDGNGYIDRIYIGTDKGFMYKVNIPDDPQSQACGGNITNCVINKGQTPLAAGTNHPLSIYASPAVMVDNTLSTSGTVSYTVRIFFGTGDNPFANDNINTASTTYTFYAYTDTDAKCACTSPATLTWFYTLAAGERVWASAFAAAGQVYFGTSTAETDDPCGSHGAQSSNSGKTYVFNARSGVGASGTGVAPLRMINTGNVTTAPLVEDQHLYVKTPTGLQSFGSGQYNNAVVSVNVPGTRVMYWREVYNQ
ncbi:MAG: hypothetical protein HQK57_12430 [Deltaproteobacteria bacterium]|nr:hypothetical protein [Deltaproteobacteria bacterium]